MITNEVKKYHQTVFFYQYTPSATLPTFTSAHISLAAYLRLFVADIIPENIHKIIYLDCDIIVNGEIRGLWDINIAEYAVAAVEDMWSGKPCYYERLNYSSKFTYFNSGVLLINLDVWRSSHIGQVSMEYAIKHASSLIFNDQDILNALLHDKKLLIPLDGMCKMVSYVEKEEYVHRLYQHYWQI